MVKSQDERCSFCGKAKTANNPLIASNPKVSGRQAFICRACTQFLYQDYFDVDEEVADGVDLKNIPSPGALKRHLDDYVVGQERAKKVFSVAVYNHYKRILNRGAFGLDGDRGNMLPPNYTGLVDDVELSKSNILLIGPTGSGKTLMAQTLARYLNIPIAISDATSLTEAGYVGEDVENILTRLYQAADYNVRRSEIGIVFIDEIDKISRLSENRSITRDVSGEGVQQALLKIIEGSTVNIPPRGGRKHPNQDFVQIDTSNILFICGGAFDGIEDIIKRKLGNNVLGFRSNDQVGDMSKKECILDHVDTEDLVSYGLIPELVGRLHVLTTLEPITKETMMYIMTEPKNAILKQYRKLFEFDEVSLEFDNEAIERIAELALAKKTGARGLRGIIEQFCVDLMFDLPNLKGYKVIITKACVDRLEEPILIKSNKKVI